MSDTRSQPVTVQTLGVNIIKPPEWNSRTEKSGDEAKAEKEAVAALANDIKARGLQTPVEVEGPAEDGSYLLIFGSRRLAATKLAGLTEITAVVRAPSSESERMVRNAAENLQRRDLTSFETCRVVGTLCGKGMPLKEVAATIGIAYPTASNYNVMWNKLSAAVKGEWQAGAPAARFEFLRILATDYAKDPDGQLKAFDAENRRIEEAKEKGESAPANDRGRPKKGEGGGSSGIHVSQHNLNYVLDFCKSGRTPSVIGDGRQTVTKDWLRGLMDWLVGQSQTAPPGLVPKDLLKEKPAPTEKGAKAAKGAAKKKGK